MWKQNSYWDLLQTAVAFADACPGEPVRFDALTFWLSARRGWGRWFGARMLMKRCFLGTCILEKQTVLTTSFIGSPSPFCLTAACLSLRSQELCESCRALCVHSPAEGSVRGYLIAQQSPGPSEPWCLLLFVWLGKGSQWDRCSGCALSLTKCSLVAASADTLCLLPACSWRLSWGVPRGRKEDKKDSVCCCLGSE